MMMKFRSLGAMIASDSTVAGHEVEARKCLKRRKCAGSVGGRLLPVDCPSKLIFRGVSALLHTF